MKSVRPHAARFVALAAIVALFGFSRLPELSGREREALAAGFRFNSTALPELSGYEYRAIRNVHPDLEQVAGWLSAMGAAIALNDLESRENRKHVRWLEKLLAFFIGSTFGFIFAMNTVCPDRSDGKT